MKESPINATKLSIHIAIFISHTRPAIQGIKSKVTIEIFSQNR